ncbi:hypothetical protein RJT34_16214 [Clitoria ternatea]|uniref:Uncharacterized protein n=1 Tax=Clitoria ternatea TaxID=43366 RepID=A0AAN9J830_CLITE
MCFATHTHHIISKGHGGRSFSARTSVAVNPKLEYVVEIKSSQEHVTSSGATKRKGLGLVLKDEKKPFLIAALELVPKLEAKWGMELVVKARKLGSELENCSYIWMVNRRGEGHKIGDDAVIFPVPALVKEDETSQVYPKFVL